ncbi:MAG: hypothetical protein E7K72_28125, partial [Roseomonas mucosa]|nr:hypothetical protein [Roseomonas mucosa]
MAKLNLKYVHEYYDRHGKLRCYFRRRGFPRTPLPGAIGSPEFMAAYGRALAGEAPKPAAPEAKDINALVTAFLRSSRFKKLRPASQRTYRAIMDGLRRDHGTKTVANLRPRHVRDLLDDKANTPTAANALRNVLRQLMAFAIERNWREDDPTEGVRKVQHRTDGHHAWTEDEIARFEGYWQPGTRARLALALLLHTGQRRGDVVKMGPAHLRTVQRGGEALTVLDVAQGKTGARLALPVSGELADALVSAPEGET